MRSKIAIGGSRRRDEATIPMRGNEEDLVGEVAWRKPGGYDPHEG